MNSRIRFARTVFSFWKKKMRPLGCSRVPAAVQCIKRRATVFGVVLK